MPGPVEVLSGVPFDQAVRAIAILRDAGIPVSVRKVVEGRWLYVAPADAERALQVLAAHRFPDPMALAGKRMIVKQSTGAAPGDDVWSLLTQDEPSWPNVYSFP